MPIPSNTRVYNILPEPVTGYRLNAGKGFWELVIPAAGRNIVTNPSMEDPTQGDNGYTALTGAGTLLRTSAKASRGAWSMKYTPGPSLIDGVYYPFDGTYPGATGKVAPARLAASTLHTVSMDVWGAPGVPYQLYLYDLISDEKRALVTFYGAGEWRRYYATGLSGIVSGGGTQHWIVIAKNSSASEQPFYFDGVMVNESPYQLTYIDGDQQTFIAEQPSYRWVGFPHNSASTRDQYTRAGGRVVSFDNYQFNVTAEIGNGMITPNNIFTSLGLTGGAIYQRTVNPPRVFAITGKFFGNDLQSVRRSKAQMEYDLRADRAIVQQPMMLRYQQYQCDIPLGPQLEIECLYQGGMEGNTDNLNQEGVALQFVAATNVYWRETLDSSLTSSEIQANVPNDHIQQRDANGQWFQSSGAFSTDGVVYALSIGPDGYLYVGGAFTQVIDATGVYTVNNIARWDGSVWSDLDDGVSDEVRAMAWDSMGNLYAGGDFTFAGALATVVNHIAKWNGSAWSAMGAGPGVDDNVRAITITNANEVMVGGYFQNAGAVPAEHIALWDGTIWSAIGNGFSSTVHALITTPNGEVFAGGDFVSFDVTTVNHIAKWNGASAFGIVGPSSSPGLTGGSVFALALGPDNTLYAAGGFTSASGNSANRVASWDGTVWRALGAGVTGGAVHALTVEPNTGYLYVGGLFGGNRVGTVNPDDGFAGWNGVAWFIPDIDLRDISIGPAEVYSLLALADRTLTVGFAGASANAVAPTVQDAENEGDAPVYPIIYLDRSIFGAGNGNIYQIVNYTTGDAIWFDNLEVLPNEHIILNLTPGQRSIISTSRGDLSSYILPGSSLSTWHLAPGINKISIYAPHAEVAVRIVWRDSYQGVEGALIKADTT